MNREQDDRQRSRPGARVLRRTARLHPPEIARARRLRASAGPLVAARGRSLRIATTAVARRGSC
jgi:hypothetical protein